MDYSTQWQDRSGQRQHGRHQHPRRHLGIFEPKPFKDIPDEDWQRFFDYVRPTSLIKRYSRRLNDGISRGWAFIEHGLGKPVVLAGAPLELKATRNCGRSGNP